MHARVGTYEGEGDALVQAFDSKTDEIRALDGFKGAYFLVDREAGKGLSVTLWDAPAALEASEAAAGQMRDDATQSAGAQTVDVANYEVAITVDG